MLCCAADAFSEYALQLQLSPLRKLPSCALPPEETCLLGSSGHADDALRPQTVELGCPLWALRSAKVATTSFLTACALALPKILVMRFNFHSSK